MKNPKIKRPLKSIPKGLDVCPYCRRRLRKNKQESIDEFKNLRWCHRCRLWIDFERRKHKNQNGFSDEGSAKELRLRMDRYYVLHRNMMKETIKIFSKKEYSQEFLKSLIPKG